MTASPGRYIIDYLTATTLWITQRRGYSNKTIAEWVQGTLDAGAGSLAEIRALSNEQRFRLIDCRSTKLNRLIKCTRYSFCEFAVYIYGNMYIYSS